MLTTGYHNIDVMLRNHYAGDWAAFKRDYAGRTPQLDAAIADIDARLARAASDADMERAMKRNGADSPVRDRPYMSPLDSLGEP